MYFFFVASTLFLAGNLGNCVAEYAVTVLERPDKAVLSYTDHTSTYTLPFNPSWIEPTEGTGNRGGLMVRTQDCPPAVDNVCLWCGGEEDKASFLTFSEMHINGKFSSITNESIVFGPSDASDAWGTEDPRVAFNAIDSLYYMFYTAYNGVDILLSLATSPNPISPDEWTRYGAVFPEYQNSKSGALLLRDVDNPPHYLFWGDSTIRVANSTDPLVWPSIGEVFLETRADYFDSRLVESGPPPLLLSNGDYIFFYNSAEAGWPEDHDAGGADQLAYNPGWVILDKTDPTIIKQRSDVPILSPTYNFEYGTDPYICNVPNVVFLEAARLLTSAADGITDVAGVDQIEVYFGAADSSIGSAIIQVLNEDIYVDTSSTSNDDDDENGVYFISTIALATALFVVIAGVMIWCMYPHCQKDGSLDKQDLMANGI
jgi:predicted GH43/DUF377 family glycosyl hydrolase